MTDKPSYLGLLNAIAVAEGHAECYLKLWADKTDDAELASTLRFVALREGEHAAAFTKRIDELGFAVRAKSADEDRCASLCEIAGSDQPDLDKFDALGFAPANDGDVFDTMFTDKTIDPVTGGLLGRYIAEERDSLRRALEDRDRIAATARTPRARRPKSKAK